MDLIIYLTGLGFFILKIILINDVIRFPPFLQSRYPSAIIIYPSFPPVWWLLFMFPSSTWLALAFRSVFVKKFALNDSKAALEKAWIRLRARCSIMSFGNSFHLFLLRTDSPFNSSRDEECWFCSFVEGAIEGTKFRIDATGYAVDGVEDFLVPSPSTQMASLNPFITPTLEDPKTVLPRE